MRGGLRFALLASLGLASLPAVADVVVVVAANSPIRNVTAEQVTDIFLGRLVRLPEGTRVSAVDQAEGNIMRDEFYGKFTGMSPAQVKDFWARMIFTGRGKPPRAVDGDAAVIRALRANTNAIGYVDRASVDATTRVLR